MTMDTDQAADYLGVSSGTLKRWRQAGIGPRYIRLSYQIVRYRQQDLDNYLAEHLVDTANQVKGRRRGSRPPGGASS